MPDVDAGFVEESQALSRPFQMRDLRLAALRATGPINIVTPCLPSSARWASGRATGPPASSVRGARAQTLGPGGQGG
jgi:hypothetical protein